MIVSNCKKYLLKRHLVKVILKLHKNPIPGRHPRVRRRGGGGGGRGAPDGLGTNGDHDHRLRPGQEEEGAPGGRVHGGPHTQAADMNNISPPEKKHGGT